MDPPELTSGYGAERVVLLYDTEPIDTIDRDP